MLEVVADDDRVFVNHRGARVRLEPSPDVEHAFAVLHPDFAQYGLLFRRAEGDEQGPFVEACWGNEWFAAPGFTGPRNADVPEAWARYTGHYRSEDPWIGSHRIALRRGRLWFDGVIPLEPAADGRFYLRDEPQSPEWVGFSDIVGTRAMRLCLSGYDLRRV